MSIRTLVCALTLTVSAAFHPTAEAQAWPNKPIRYIVPFAPGGTTDILGRMVAPASDALGQPVVVENKPGQAGSIGAAELARAAPDGYTIGGGTISSHAINASLYDKLPYDPIKDFAPITMLATLPNMLVVHPSINVANNVRSWSRYSRQTRTRFSFGSAGNGTSQHISGELFKIMTGTQMQHIPYKGSGPMIPDLLVGHHPAELREHHHRLSAGEGGQAEGAGGDLAKRSFVAPEVPTMAEAGPAGYDISSWQAMFAPGGTPKEIIARLHAETAKILRAPENAKKLQDLGLDPAAWPPEELTALMRVRDPAARQGRARLRREGGLTTTSPGDVVARRSDKSGKRDNVTRRAAIACRALHLQNGSLK